MARPKKTEFETKADYDNWYIKTQKERVNVLFDLGTKDRIKVATGKTGQTASEFIREAVEEKLSKSEK